MIITDNDLFNMCSRVMGLDQINAKTHENGTFGQFLASNGNVAKVQKLRNRSSYVRNLIKYHKNDY